MIQPGTSTGRICEGYPMTATATKTLSSLEWQITTYASPLSIPVSTVALIDQTEARSLEFFHLNSLTEFSSVFKDEFWTEIVPQMANSEPAIRHGIAALSSYHEGAHETFALKRYNLAIRELTQPQPGISSVPLEVQMISCIIFFNIEVGVVHVTTSKEHN
jgi:hypothetical protein